MELLVENMDFKMLKVIKCFVSKGEDDDYMKKWERNNIVVRKSCMKVKEWIEEIRWRVVDLVKENEELWNKVFLL